MPQRDTTGIGERVPREIIDGDFTVAFSLVEIAEGEALRNNGLLASQLLQKSERMLDDIRKRLVRMSAAQKQEFEPRCAELAKAIESARPTDPGHQS